METRAIQFEGIEFQFEKGEQTWELSLRRSDVDSKALLELKVLEMKHPYLLSQTSSWDEEKVTFVYQLDEYGVSWADAKQKVMSEKLRLALNMTDLEACLQLPITFFIHPENLFITKDATVKLAYRALPEYMLPKKMDRADFLRQMKCLLVALFTDFAFDDLYNGVLETAPIPSFLRAVVDADDMEIIREQLKHSFEEVSRKEALTLRLVSRRNFAIFKHLSIWLSVLSVALMVPLVYLVFVQGPFRQTLLNADTNFLKVNYSAVISDLETIAIDDLPYTQKYELAYSYIQGLGLSEDQKKFILNNVSLKSDELYLDYWVEIGRGEHDTALDTAKRLEDNDLIIYALIQKMVAVRKDDSLTGEERNSLLGELQSEYDQYNEARQSILAEEEETTTASSSDK